MANQCQHYLVNCQNIWKSIKTYYEKELNQMYYCTKLAKCEHKTVLDDPIQLYFDRALTVSDRQAVKRASDTDH